MRWADRVFASGCTKLSNSALWESSSGLIRVFADRSRYGQPGCASGLLFLIGTPSSEVASSKTQQGHYVSFSNAATTGSDRTTPSAFGAAVRLSLLPVLGDPHQISSYVLGPFRREHRPSSADMRQTLDRLREVCEALEASPTDVPLPDWIVDHRAPDFVVVLAGAVIAVPLGLYIRRVVFPLRWIWQARPFGWPTRIARVIEMIVAAVIAGIVLWLIFGN